jgi:mRNA-degrading endonuclease toxin of MazEF toxin-antitoxin module
MQQKKFRLRVRILVIRRTEVKIHLSIAVAAAISTAVATAGFAAELPSYEVKGLQISAVQVRVLGAADVREQSPALTSTVTAHQLSVLTPRKTRTAETAAPTPTTGRAIR